MSKPAVFDDSEKDHEDFILSDQCDDYVPEIKKGKYERKPESSNDDIPMPERYCHIKIRGLDKTMRNTDLKTLPSMKNLLHTEPFFEAMTLNEIAEGMMDENVQPSITFPNDKSSMSGVGAYVIQSLPISAVQCALPRTY